MIGRRFGESRFLRPEGLGYSDGIYYGRLGGLCGRWLGGLLGLRGGGGLKAAATLGRGREEVVVVAGDGVVDGLAPGIGAEGFTIFVLGDVDGLQESLGQVGDG